MDSENFRSRFFGGDPNTNPGMGKFDNFIRSNAAMKIVNYMYMNMMVYKMMV